MPFFDKDDFRGVASNRVRRPYKLFEACLDEVLGERVRADGACGVDLWCAIASVGWRSPEGHEVRYSYRQACDVVAWVREEVDGFEYYCSGEPGIVADWIAQALGQAGWSLVPAEPTGGWGDTSPSAGRQNAIGSGDRGDEHPSEHDGTAAEPLPPKSSPTGKAVTRAASRSRICVTRDGANEPRTGQQRAGGF